MTKRNISTAAGRRALVAEMMALQSDPSAAISMVQRLEHLCHAAVHNLAVSGVSVCLMSDTGSAGVLAGSDRRSANLDELQFTVGEGPGLDAIALRRPVLTADLQSLEGRRWPGYSAAAQEAGVRGVFAFPLHIGAVAFGILSIYAADADSLDARQVTMALTFAEIATEVLLNEDATPDDGKLHLGVETVLLHRAEIYQAQGAVMVDLGVSLAEALTRMRAYAFANDLSLADLASAIMSGGLVLEIEGG